MLSPVREALIYALIETCLHRVQIVKPLALSLGGWQAVLSDSDASFFYATGGTVI